MVEIIVVSFFFILVGLFFLYTFMKTKKKSQAKVQFFNELVEAMKNKVHQAIEVEHLNILHRNVLHTKKKFGKKKEYIEKLDHVIKLIEEKLEAIRKNKPNGNQTRLQT